MLILLIASLALQTALFANVFLDEIELQSPLNEASVKGLEAILDDTPIPLIFGFTLVILTVILCIQGTAFSSQTSYTMARLSISEKSTFVWQAAYNSLAILLFLAAEGVLMFGLCSWYEASSGVATEQSVFLALYRNEFLHNMLPLHDISRTVRNICYTVGLGTSAAYYTYRQRNGNASYTVVIMLIYVVYSMLSDGISLSFDIVNCLIPLATAAYMIVMILTKFEFLLGEEEENTTWTR